MRLQGKKVVVTGAGIGIGREVALEMARQGADVVLSYCHSSQGALSAAEEILKMGRQAKAIRADLSRVEDCFALIDQAVAFLGGLDVLVNNAGQTIEKAFLDVTPEDFDHLFALNIRGQFFCAQRAVPAMQERGGGVILNVLSVHALASRPLHSIYEGTKGAIWAWTRQIAIELASKRIRVVGIAPGAIEVPRYFKIPGYTAERMGKLVPWGRVGKPIDIAKVCAFLASEDADYITGTTVVVDGGVLARMAFDTENW